MTRFGLNVVVLLTGLLMAGGEALAQNTDVRVVRVQFPSGATGTTISDRITGYQSVSYRLSARAGQVLQVDLTPRGNRNTYFNVYGPGRGPGDRALASSDITGPMVPELNRFEGELGSSGVYTVSVFQLRNAAHQNLTSNYALRIAITERAVHLPGESEQGGAVPGEPRFWRVTGLPAGDTLNVRSGPSTQYRVIDRLRQDTVIRNRGCQQTIGSARWCKISRIGRPDQTGWVSARFLVPARETGGGTATQLPGTAPAPDTGSSATGRLPCTVRSVARQCSFRVIRRGNGDATLTMTLQDNSLRRIDFTAGRPVSSNGPGDVFGEWRGDNVVVTIGPSETYTVPNAVLFGG